MENTKFYSSLVRTFLIIIGTGSLCFSCSQNLPKEVALAYEELPENVDFNFHVKPILSDRCFNCHGPDENTRKAGLRLDLEESAFAVLASNKTAFDKGGAKKSEVVQRILSKDPALLMPPKDSHLELSDREKALIIKWVEQGAEWNDHWSFIAPKKPDVPVLEHVEEKVNNEIDRFVHAKLLANQFGFSPETNKELLLRRLAIDITGLPPTLDEIDGFLQDKSPDAYEKMVDKYLASDACAERLALDWMDLSRYADSHGLHADGWRNMWPWRDWVIKAFQENMPYDQFVTWQLAGDLLPNATKEQKLATAFNRNSPMTGEGGVIDEEFRLNYVFDRVETTSTAFLGLTVACAKCHDHKFDPISQKDYFEMSAFFNNVKELGMTGDDGNFGPLLPLVDDSTQTKLDAIDQKIIRKEEALDFTKKELLALNTYINNLPNNVRSKGLLGHYPLEKVRKRRAADAKLKFKGLWGFELNDFLIDDSPKATISKQPKIVKGVVGNAIEITGDYDELYLQELPNFEYIDAFSASLWVNTTKREAGKTQTLLGTSGEKNSHWRGWEFYLDSLNHLNIRLISSLPENLIHVKSRDSIKTHTWNNLSFTYNGSGKATGISLFINGDKAASETVQNKLYKSIKTTQTLRHDIIENRPWTVGKSNRKYTGDDGIFIGKVDDIYLYERKLSAIEIKTLVANVKFGNTLLADTDKKTELVKEYWINTNDQVAKEEKELKKLRGEWLALMNPVSEIMIMEEMPESRTTFLYDRGEYELPKDTVYPATLSVLQEFPDDYPKNRLGLAQWLFEKDNPLTARVAVNRYWQMLFGKGLVKTPHDFGVQGALPTHPELLDWLSVNFMEQHWDVKKLLKTMVMSHTYRQSSKVSQEMAEKDPENIFLSRSNSYRLPAETIRDNALAASGLLVRDVGGISVKPYLPYDLWLEKSSFSYKLLNYVESKGDSLYRRGMYTFVRRTSPHPAMSAFDAPSRDVCTLQRENTNTPLQALVLLNDTQFVEASRVLAERIQHEGGTLVEEQIAHAFRLATSRKPKPKELQLLTELYRSQENRFKSDPKAALELLKVGDKDFDTTFDTSKTAALTIVSNTILNHDETFMKR